MAKWIGTKRRKERKEAKKRGGRGKKTMIRGACIAGPSNIQYGPEGGPCPNNHLSRAPTYSYVLRLKGVSGESFAPRDVNTVACALARETRRALDPIQSPTTLSNWSAPDPIPRSSHIDADNYAACYVRSLSFHSVEGGLPRRGFRGFPNCEIAIVAPLYRNGWMGVVGRGVVVVSRDLLRVGWRYPCLRRGERGVCKFRFDVVGFCYSNTLSIRRFAWILWFGDLETGVLIRDFRGGWWSLIIGNALNRMAIERLGVVSCILDECLLNGTSSSYLDFMDSSQEESFV